MDSKSNRRMHGDGNKPESGYVCKYCEQPGGMPQSHWHNRCSKCGDDDENKRDKRRRCAPPVFL